MHRAIFFFKNKSADVFSQMIYPKTYKNKWWNWDSNLSALTLKTKHFPLLYRVKLTTDQASGSAQFLESSILSINRIKLLLLSCWYQVGHGLFQDRSRRIRNKCTGSFFIISYHDHKSALMLSRSLSLPV